jgi:hypothetical protein
MNFNQILLENLIIAQSDKKFTAAFYGTGSAITVFTSILAQSRTSQREETTPR